MTVAPVLNISYDPITVCTSPFYDSQLIAPPLSLKPTCLPVLVG